MEERRIEYLPLDEVPSALKNPKRHDDELLDASFGRFGVVDIPVVDERTGRLVSGHGRRDTILRARDSGAPPPDGVRVREDGTWLVPVVRGWASVDDDDAHAAGVAMNRASEAGGWDDREVTELLRELNEHDPLAGLVGTGYDEMNLAALLMTTRTAAEIEDFDEAAEWIGMADYTPEVIPWKLVVSFDTQEDRNEFIDKFGIRDQVTFTHGHARTVSARWPILTEPLNDAGLRWEEHDDPLGVWSTDDPSAPLGVGPEGGDPEQPVDPPLAGSEGPDVEAREENLREPGDPPHGPETVGAPEALPAEEGSTEAGETPPSGLHAPASSDA